MVERASRRQLTNLLLNRSGQYKLRQLLDACARLLPPRVLLAPQDLAVRQLVSDVSSLETRSNQLGMAIISVLIVRSPQCENGPIAPKRPGDPVSCAQIPPLNAASQVELVPILRK